MSTLRTNAILDASGGNTATINTVPLRPGVLDPGNRHYDEIMRQVDAGTLVIQEADA